jgi:hypothetical protein
MILLHLLFAVFFAALIGGLLVGAFRARTPWTGFAIFFLVLFLATWAGGVWMTPMGGAIWGVHWFPFLLTAIIVALLLAAATAAQGEPADSTMEFMDEAKMERERRATAAAFGVFFWILLLALGISIVVRYLF